MQKQTNHLHMHEVAKGENVLATLRPHWIQHACFLVGTVTAGTDNELNNEIEAVLSPHPTYFHFYQLAQNQLNSHDLSTRQGLFQFNLIEVYIIYIWSQKPHLEMNSLIPNL